MPSIVSSKKLMSIKEKRMIETDLCHYITDFPPGQYRAVNLLFVLLI